MLANVEYKGLPTRVDGYFLAMGMKADTSIVLSAVLYLCHYSLCDTYDKKINLTRTSKSLSYAMYLTACHFLCRIIV